MFVWYGLKREYLRSSTSLERYGSGCRTGMGCAVAVGTAGYVCCKVAGVYETGGGVAGSVPQIGQMTWVVGSCPLQWRHVQVCGLLSSVSSVAD